MHHPIQVEFNEFTDWLQLMTLKSKLKKNDNVTIVLSRENLPSYNDSMAHIPSYINKYLKHQNFLLIYPSQLDLDDEKVDMTYPSLITAIEKIDGIGKTVAGIFKKKQL